MEFADWVNSWDDSQHLRSQPLPDVDAPTRFAGALSYGFRCRTDWSRGVHLPASSVRPLSDSVQNCRNRAASVKTVGAVPPDLADVSAAGALVSVDGVLAHPRATTVAASTKRRVARSIDSWFTPYLSGKLAVRSLQVYAMDCRRGTHD